MPIAELKTQMARLPEQPGVYLFLNAAGDTIYVGKARVLRDRVRSYLSARGASPKTDALLDEAAALETIVTDSVVEALALENHLIKQRAPRYNILLRDDKNYPYLRLTATERFPRVLVARRVERDGSVYAGPFLPASLARKTMALTHRLFGMRSCNEVIDGRRGRPCLEHEIRRCIAPCVAAICSEAEYREAVEHTRLFLEGRTEELVAGLEARMAAAAEAERFEQAAELRDAIRTIETVRGRQQKMASTGLGDRDAFGLKAGPAGAVVEVFQVRGGRVVERVELVTEAAGDADARPPYLQAALQQFYEDHPVPPEVHLPHALDEGEAEPVEAWLSGRAGRRVRLLVPQRGEKRGLLELAARNAAVAYEARFNENVAANYDALETLGAALELPALPRRIECFDISTIQGSETVASMVVCEDGRMKRVRVPEVPGAGLGPPAFAPARFGPASRRAKRRRSALRARRLRVDGGGRAPALPAPAGAGRAVSRPGAHRRRQGPAVVGLPRLRAARPRQPGGGRDREEGGADPHARPRDAARARRARPGAAAHPAHSRRGAPLRRDVPPPGARAPRPAVRARRDRRRRPPPAAGAADRGSGAWPASGAPRARSSWPSSARRRPTPCWRTSRGADRVRALELRPVLPYPDGAGLNDFALRGLTPPFPWQT